MNPTVKAARIAGAIYLLEALSGPFGLIYVPSTLVVSGNAAATAANILAHETMFRLGILSDLYTGVVSIVLGLPWLLDMLWPLWDARNQTLHDKVVSTVVIRI